MTTGAYQLTMIKVIYENQKSNNIKWIIAQQKKTSPLNGTESKLIIISKNPPPLKKYDSSNYDLNYRHRERKTLVIGANLRMV